MNIDSNLVWVIENINGDIIGVADSFAKALLIYEERYQDTPESGRFDRSLMSNSIKTLAFSIEEEFACA